MQMSRYDGRAPRITIRHMRWLRGWRVVGLIVLAFFVLLYLASQTLQSSS
jgi:hypothetical protein